MKLIIGIMAAAAVLASTTAWSQEEVGRFQVIIVPWSTFMEDAEAELDDPTFRDAALMVDTATGETWVMQKDGIWHSVRYKGHPFNCLRPEECEK